jgi:hypothetical protein
MQTRTAFLTRTIVAGLVLTLAPAAALAQGRAAGCELGDYDPVQRPDPEGTPTEVGVGVYVVRLDRVDNVDESFRLDGFFTLAWRDERLAAVVRAANRQQCRFALGQVWEPHLVIFNRRSTSVGLPDVVTVDTEGQVRYVQRIQSTLVAPMDLQDFPMDRQSLPITLISFEYGPDDVTLSLDETAGSRETDVSISGWEIDELLRRGGVLEVKAGKSGAVELFARFDYEFRVHRDISYYVWRVIGPLTFIVLMSWAVFWIDPGNFGVQIGLASTSILTLVAFLFSLNNVLPPLSYLTRMDIFLFSSLALAFLAFGEAVMTAVLKAREQEALALRIDRWARWVFPITFAILHLVLWTM